MSDNVPQTNSSSPAQKESKVPAPHEIALYDIINKMTVEEINLLPDEKIIKTCMPAELLPGKKAKPYNRALQLEFIIKRKQGFKKPKSEVNTLPKEPQAPKETKNPEEVPNPHVVVPKPPQKEKKLKSEPDTLPKEPQALKDTKTVDLPPKEDSKVDVKPHGRHENHKSKDDSKPRRQTDFDFLVEKLKDCKCTAEELTKISKFAEACALMKMK